MKGYPEARPAPASPPALRFVLLVGACMAGPAIAQDEMPNPGACAAIGADVERLACYDSAFRRPPPDPELADAEALDARASRQARDDRADEERAPLPRRERARLAFSDLFRDEGAESGRDRIANAGRGGLLDSRWELAKDSKLGVFNFRAYKPVYLLPAFWNNNTNPTPRSSDPGGEPVASQPVDALEAKFQISFKTKALENLIGDNGDVWMGYTQSSRWQVYNTEASRPFRETNYEPEVMLVFRTGYSLGGWRGRMAGIGINHQSNGRADPLSRSWNRVVANIGLDRENWALTLRPWWRLSDGDEDENPGIENYIGRGDLTLVHTRDGHEFALMARHSLRGGDDSRGALQFDWGFPINRTLRGHVQVFDGYGESLIDYDHRATHIGLGISLLEWF